MRLSVLAVCLFSIACLITTTAPAAIITVDGGENTNNVFWAGTTSSSSTDWLPHLGWVYQDIVPFTLNPGDTIAFDTIWLTGGANTYHLDIALGTGTLSGSPAIGNVVYDTASFSTIVDDGIASSVVGSGIGDFDVVFTVTDTYVFNGGLLVIDFSAGDLPGIPVLDASGVFTHGGKDAAGAGFLGRYRQASAPGVPGIINGGDIGSFQISTQSVPEPATVTVWSLLGLCGVGYGVRRRTKKAA